MGGELYLTDMNNPKPGVKLTNLNSVPQYQQHENKVGYIWFSKDCKRALFTAGRYQRQHLYSIQLDPPKPAVCITGPVSVASHYLGDHVVMTADGSHVAFIAGPIYKSASVQLYKLGGAAGPKKLFTPPGGHRLILLGVQ